MVRIFTIFLSYVLFAAAFVGASAAQTCPTSANAKTRTIASAKELVDSFSTASPEERARLTRTVRANTIMLWDHQGVSGLAGAKDGLSVLTRCVSSGGCGFEKQSSTVVAEIYDFINGKRASMPAALQKPPPAAVEWARDQLGCSIKSTPPQTVATSSSAVRPVPVLVPEDEDGAEALLLMQAAVQVLYDGCHFDPPQYRAKSCYELGSILERGINGYKYDYEAALYYLERACDEGEKFGCSRYGASLRRWGKTPAEKDRGTEYVGKACKMGDDASCFNFKAWTGTDAREQ